MSSRYLVRKRSFRPGWSSDRLPRLRSASSLPRSACFIGADRPGPWLDRRTWSCCGAPRLPGYRIATVRVCRAVRRFGVARAALPPGRPLPDVCWAALGSLVWPAPLASPLTRVGSSPSTRPVLRSEAPSPWTPLSLSIARLRGAEVGRSRSRPRKTFKPSCRAGATPPPVRSSRGSRWRPSTARSPSWHRAS